MSKVGESIGVACAEKTELWKCVSGILAFNFLPKSKAVGSSQFFSIDSL